MSEELNGVLKHYKKLTHLCTVNPPPPPPNTALLSIACSMYLNLQGIISLINVTLSSGREGANLFKRAIDLLGLDIQIEGLKVCRKCHEQVTKVCKTTS